MTLPYSLEQDLFDRKNRALDLVKQGYTTDPVTLSRLIGISRTWPALNPGVVLSAAQSGLDRNSPQLHALNRLAIKQDANADTWGTSLSSHPDKSHGDTTTAPDPLATVTAPSPATSLADLDPDQLLGFMSRVRSDQNRLLADKMKAEAFQSKWGFDGVNDADASKRLNDAVIYQLGQKNPKAVADAISAAPKKNLTFRNLDQYHTLLGTVRDQSSIASDMASINASLPVQALKFATRELGTVANAGLQTVQGVIRNQAGGGTLMFSNSGQPVADQTDLGQQANALASGTDASLGNGFLPSPKSGPALAAHQAQLQAAPTIGGHAFTLGRAAANQIFEPDTNAFNVLSGVVDAGVALKADPAASILSTIGDVRAGAESFAPQVNNLSTATGLYPTSSRLFVDPPTKANYLAGTDFESHANALMDIADGSPSRMMRAINDANTASPTFPITTIHGQPLIEDLARASESRDVNAFRDSIAQATDVQSPLSPPGVNYKIRQGADYRIFASMPTGSIADPYDKNTNWKILDDVMRAGNVPVAERDAALDRYLTDKSPISAIGAVSDTISSRLVSRYNIDPEEARGLASFFKDRVNTSRLYDVDQATGVTRVTPGIGIAGDAHPLPAPMLLSEGLNSPISIPDLRALRRAASDFNFITNTKPWKVTQTALSAPAALWKPLQVLSARMGVRIFGESQLNLATRGSINAFTDPVDTIALLAGTNTDNRLGMLLGHVPGVNASFRYGPDGLGWAEDADNLLMHSASFIHDPETIVTKGFIGVAPTHPEAGRGLAEQLGRMHADPIMRGIAEAADPAAAKEWFFNGAGKEFRLARAPITANTDAWNAQKLAAGTLSDYTPIGDLVNDRAAADSYIDNIMYPRLRDMTGDGHTELLDAVRTGKLNGRDIYNIPNGRKDLGVINEHAANYAKSLLDQGIGPQRTIPIREILDNPASQRAANYGKHALDMVFHALVDVPDRVMNRNTAWVQSVWDNSIQNAPYLTDQAALDQLIASAERDRLPAEMMSRLRATTLDNTSAQRLTIPQLTKLSKLNAADDIKHIVHDLTSRSQFFDMTRALFPFGDAFRLVLGRMAKLAVDEPQVVRRVQQGLQEAQSSGSSTVNRLMGDPVAPGDGFFHNDPSTGEEVFTYPGSTLVDSSLLGIPIPLQGQVSGLSMLGEGYPGLGGPALTISAKWFLPDTPLGNHVRDIIFPFGTTPTNTLAGDVAQTFVPPWFDKVTKALSGTIDQKTYNSLTLQTMNTLMSQGGYDKSKPADMQRLAADAKEDAKWLYLIRGVAQFVTPGAPTANMQSYDKAGHLIATELLAKQYHADKDKYGPDKAMAKFIDMWGTKNIFVTQSASVPNSYALPITKDGQDWVDSHPGIESKYPLTFGLFAPPPPKNAWDGTTFDEQYAKGQRRSLTPAEQIAQTENRLGFYAYDNKKAEIIKANGGTNFSTEQQAWLRDYRAHLKELFPGFDSYLASPYDSQKRRTTAIEELQAAAKDPTILSTDAGQGLKQYLGYRQTAMNGAKEIGLASPFQAAKARDMREWLRSGAEAAVTDHPAFRSIYDQIFVHEFTTEGK